MRQLKITKSITHRDDISTEKYLSDIGKIDLISALEETQLAQRIKLWDQQALEKLVKANLRFVVSVAKQYQNQGLSLPDLISEGNLWLIKAAQRFDETRGFKFISCAVWWIRQSILQALAEQARIVRLPLNKIGSINRINRKYSELEQILERIPTSEELAEALELSENEINQLQSDSQRSVSLDTPLSEDSDSSTLIEVILSDMDNPDEWLDKESLRQDIIRVLRTLDKKEEDVIYMFFWIGMNSPLSLEEIGERMDLTRERVRQIKEKAIKRMRQRARHLLLKKHLW